MNGMPETIQETLRRILDAINGEADAPGNDVNGMPKDVETFLRGIADALESGGGGGSLSELSDTAITTPSDNDVLTYDSDSGKWKNAAGGSGGGGLIVTATEENESFVLDKTWKEIHDAIASGQNVSILLSADFGQYAMTVVSCLYAEGDQKPYIVVSGDSSFEFTAALQTDYPST